MFKISLNVYAGVYARLPFSKIINIKKQILIVQTGKKVEYCLYFVEIY